MKNNFFINLEGVLSHTVYLNKYNRKYLREYKSEELDRVEYIPNKMTFIRPYSVFFLDFVKSKFVDNVFIISDTDGYDSRVIGSRCFNISEKKILGYYEWGYHNSDSSSYFKNCNNIFIDSVPFYKNEKIFNYLGFKDTKNYYEIEEFSPIYDFICPEEEKVLFDRIKEYLENKYSNE